MQQAYQFYSKLPNIIEKQATELENHRKLLNNELKNKIDEFKGELVTLKQQI